MPASVDPEIRWVFDDDAIRERVFLPLARAVITDLLLVGMGLAPASDAPHAEIVAHFQSVSEDYFAAEITSDAFAEAFLDGRKNLLTILEVNSRWFLLSFRRAMTEWSVFITQTEYIRGYWAAEMQSHVFYSQYYAERSSIQMNAAFLHNMIVQSCDVPVGYPALVTPIMTSYSFPPHREQFDE
jgi:hypothetical protein